MWAVSSGWPSRTTGAPGPLGARVGEQAQLVEGARVEALGLVDGRYDAPPSGRGDRQPRAQEPGEARGRAAGRSAPVARQRGGEQGGGGARRVGHLGHVEALAIEGLAQRLREQGLPDADLPRDHHQAPELRDAEQDARQALAVVGALEGEARVGLQPEGRSARPQWAR